MRSEPCTEKTCCAHETRPRAACHLIVTFAVQLRPTPPHTHTPFLTYLSHSPTAPFHVSINTLTVACLSPAQHPPRLLAPRGLAPGFGQHTFLSPHGFGAVAPVLAFFANAFPWGAT